MKRAQNVEEYLSLNAKDRNLLEKIRNVIVSSGIEETIKWGVPTYTYKNRNLVGLAAFKYYVGVWFHEGALLSDFASKLINAQEGKTKGLRQWRMVESMELEEEVLRAYVMESIENVDNGLKMKKEAPVEVSMPIELQEALNQDALLRSQFEQLSPFKQKEYKEYIASAKRESTRKSRLDKVGPMIKEGIGLNDKYRKK